MFSLIRRRKEEKKLAREFEKPFGRTWPEMAELFDRFLSRWAPLMDWPREEADLGLDLEEREKEVLVRVEVPGFEPAEVVVEVTGDVLTIRGEHKEEKESAEKPSYRMMRSLTLPMGIDKQKVEAHCKNGMLEVLLPRVPEAATRRIEVKT